MPAIARTVRHVYVPSGVGKGGMFPNTNAQEGDPLTLATVQNFYIDGGRWQGRKAPTEFADLGVNSISSIQNVGSGSIGVIDSGNFARIFNQAGAALATASGVNPPGNFETVRSRVYLTNGAVQKLFDPAINASQFIRWGQASQVGVLTYDMLSTVVYNTGALNGAGPCGNGVCNGSTTVTATGTAFVAGMVGKTIFILGVPYTIAAVPTGLTLTLSTAYAGPNANIPNGSWQINQSNISFTAGNGLRYAVSYYNPTSGHTSNMSPVVSVDDGNPNNLNVLITIRNITYDYGAFNDGYTKIIIWRSAHGGGALLPLDVINNANAGGPVTYPDNNNSDQILGQQVGFFIGPVTTNLPPPTDLQFATYWDGRMWGWSASKQAIFYSIRADDVASFIGVSEESWPPTFFKPLPQSDFTVTGIKVVANVLMISGGLAIYTIRGNTIQNYVIQTLSSKGSGSFHYAMDRLPGEDNNSSDILIHYGNDQRLYFLYGQGGDVSYSYPIQSSVTSTAVSAHVKVCHQPSSVYIYAGIKSVTATSFVFDVERKIWFTHNIESSGGFTEVKDTTLLSMRPVGTTFTGGHWHLAFYDMVGTSASSPLTSAYAISSLAGFAIPGVPRDVVKTFQQMNVFRVNNTTDVPTTVQLTPFGIGGGAPVNLTNISAASDQVFRNMEPGQLVFVPPSGTQIDGLTFFWNLNWSGPTNPPDVSMIELVFTVMTEDESIPGQL